MLKRHHLAALSVFILALSLSYTHRAFDADHNAYTPVDYRGYLAQTDVCRSDELTYQETLEQIQAHAVGSVCQQRLNRSVRQELASLQRQAGLSPSSLDSELSALPSELAHTSGLPENVAYHAATLGLLKALDHPEAELIEHESFGCALLSTSGIGAIIGPAPGARGIRLQTVLPGGAADQAGLQSGDLILSIDGRSANRMPQTMAVGLLRGQAGQPVSLTVRRGSGLSCQVQSVHLVRQPLDFDTTVIGSVENGVAKIRVFWFDSRTVWQLEELLADFASQGVDKLELDLTTTASGSLSDAASSAGLFLETGTTVARTRSRQTEATFSTSNTRRYLFETTVKVGPNTRRAAEVFAHALSHHGAARLVGEPTAGDGLLPGHFSAGFAASVKFPTQEVILADGRKLEGNGLNPPIRGLSDALSRL